MAAGRKTRQPVTDAVLEFMRGNADRPLLVREVTEATGMLTTSVSGALTTLSRTCPERISRVQRGVYVYHSTAREVQPQPTPQPAPSRDLLLTFVSESTNAEGETTRLMRDDDTGSLYVVRLFVFAF